MLSTVVTSANLFRLPPFFFFFKFHYTALYDQYFVVVLIQVNGVELRGCKIKRFDSNKGFGIFLANNVSDGKVDSCLFVYKLLGFC